MILHRLAELKARSAFWLVALALVLQVFLTAERGVGARAAVQHVTNLSSALNSTPPPVSAGDARQVIASEEWRPSAKQDPQDKAAAPAAGPALPVVHGRAILPAVASGALTSGRPRLFDPRGPPLPLAAA